MEVATVRLNSLVAPFSSCCEKPGEGEDNPPDGAGHAKVIEDEEDYGAASALQTLPDNIELSVFPIAGDILSPGH